MSFFSAGDLQQHTPEAFRYYYLFQSRAVDRAFCEKTLDIILCMIFNYFFYVALSYGYFFYIVIYNFRFPK
jgi:hypothetical protein